MYKRIIGSSTNSLSFWGINDLLTLTSIISLLPVCHPLNICYFLLILLIEIY